MKHLLFIAIAVISLGLISAQGASDEKKMSCDKGSCCCCKQNGHPQSGHK